MATANALLLLFDRPTEPAFMPKGANRTVFQIPNNLLPARFNSTEIYNRFVSSAQSRIVVKSIQVPALTQYSGLARYANFSVFMQSHRQMCSVLIQNFLDASSIDDLLATAVYYREHLNPYLFNYCLSVALMHRQDTQHLAVPSYVHTFPDKYLDSQVFQRAREQANIVPEGSRTPLVVPQNYTASDLESEHRVAYWREDIGANIHHWHWHMVYPFEGPREIVAKNRRGELFYYMHQQLLARYNFERLCNQLSRTTRLINWRLPIREGYFPKLDCTVAGRAWVGRPSNAIPQNVTRPIDQVYIDLEDMERWTDRILDAIQTGYVIDVRGQRIQLTEFEGVDILGNIIESTILSTNRAFYGDIHNMGHTLLSFIHDPDNRHLEQMAVMGDAAVDLRDPVFFRWHAFIDDLFQRFKETLPRYTVAQLNFEGISVDRIQIQTQDQNPNIISTFWQQSDVDLSRGMDFQPRGPVFVRFTHLQHVDFRYLIAVTNQGPARRGTCRIFLAPKFDERRNQWFFRDQRQLFIEMDRFPVNLVQGQNTIRRLSTQSALTIPFEQTFRDLDEGRPSGTDANALDAYNFCGCGWPQHLLVPKGTAQGFVCQLFVMISNYEEDHVEQPPGGPCSNADVFCGIKNRLYPDRRAMGYPFDRLPRTGVDTLQQFVTRNMHVQDVLITFNNTVYRPRNSTNN